MAIKIKIPFIRKRIEILKTNGLNLSNGNGYKITTIVISIITLIGTGDNDDRTITN